MPVPGLGEEKSLRGIRFELNGQFGTGADYDMTPQEFDALEAVEDAFNSTTPTSLKTISEGLVPSNTSPHLDKEAPHSMDEFSELDNDKIICSYMNETYNMSPVMNRIWLAYTRKMKSPHIIQKGYHALFIPLIVYSKSSKRFSNIVRKCIEDIAISRTRDIIAEYKNTSRWNRGHLYRIILEPICYIVGKCIIYKQKK